MKIVTLAERLALTDTLAGWHFTEWAGLYAGWTLQACRAELETHDNPNRIPTTLVGLEDDGTPVGSVSLLVDDLARYECYSPWLANLFVHPERRGAGLGNILVAAAMAEARRLGVERLYLYTPAHADYYAARGWAEIDRASANGKPVTLMTRRC